MLLCGLLFWGVAYLLWSRMRRWSWLPALVGLVMMIYALGLVANDRDKRMAFKHYQQLQTAFGAEDLWQQINEQPTEADLMLVGLSSMAFYRAAQRFPAYRDRIEGTMRAMAEWVNNPERFPAWNDRRNWEQRTFFLSQAAIILGHYQLISLDEQLAPRWQSAAEYLGRNMIRSPYKNLISRPSEDYFRVADNAAALYAISLHDQYYASTYFETAYSDWSTYIARELQFEEGRLPCSAFSSTNRCKLEPNAVALGLTYAYLAAAQPDQVDPIGYREWLHFFKQSSLSPFSLTISGNQRGKDDIHHCDEGAYPLACQEYENAIGLWLTADQKGWYTYARLFSTLRLRERLKGDIDYSAWRPRQRIAPLTRLALETIGLLHTKSMPS